MIFELEKSYIVNVTKKGIIPLMEFDNSQWYNKDCDDLDFLTDEEKVVIVNDVLDKIREEIQENINYNKKMNYQGIVAGLLLALNIINKYKTESEESK